MAQILEVFLARLNVPYEETTTFTEKIRFVGIRNHTALSLVVETGGFNRFAKRNVSAACGSRRKNLQLRLMITGKNTGQSVKAEHFHNGWIEFDTNEDCENACKWVDIHAKNAKNQQLFL